MNSYHDDNEYGEDQGGVLSDNGSPVPSVSLSEFIEELLRQPALEHRKGKSRPSRAR
jgi:hypothetical protein